MYITYFLLGGGGEFPRLPNQLQNPFILIGYTDINIDSPMKFFCFSFSELGSRQHEKKIFIASYKKGWWWVDLIIHIVGGISNRERLESIAILIHYL